jgi:hypothetical protein
MWWKHLVWMRKKGGEDCWIDVSWLQDALCKTQLELVELLDVPFEAVSSAVAVISEKVCPPVHTVRVSSKILEFFFLLLTISCHFQKVSVVCTVSSIAMHLDFFLMSEKILLSFIISSINHPSYAGSLHFERMCSSIFQALICFPFDNSLPFLKGFRCLYYFKHLQCNLEFLLLRER